MERKGGVEGVILITAEGLIFFFFLERRDCITFCVYFVSFYNPFTRPTSASSPIPPHLLQLLTCMDGLSLEGTENKPVMVIGATNRPDTLDSALRRAGRFDREISMGVPDEEARLNILKVMAKKMRLEGDFNFEEVAKKTPGYVGADIRSLTKEAAVFAINRIFKDVLKLDSFDRASGTGEKIL